MSENVVCPRIGSELDLESGTRRHGVSLQHFGADLAGGDLAQRDHRRLVAVRLDERRGAGAELARAIGGGQRELEAVGDSLQAIVDGDASHGGFRFLRVWRVRPGSLPQARAARYPGRWSLYGN